MKVDILTGKNADISRNVSTLKPTIKFPKTKYVYLYPMQSLKVN